MRQKELLENFYQSRAPDKIMWEKTQATFLRNVLKTYDLPKGKALDIGGGLGKKAVLLSQNGYEVTSVDISPTAIEHARKHATQEKQNIRFITADATNLSMLKDEEFDLILDWACLHCIPKEKQRKYVDEVSRITKPGGYLILRCFSKHKMSPDELGFLTPLGPIYLFSRKDLRELYGNEFTFVKFNRSKPYNHHYRWFEEVLMRRKAK